MESDSDSLEISASSEGRQTAAGTRLGPYEIESRLGAGGMGEVYRAKDTRLGRAVAIKIIPPHLAASSWKPAPLPA